MTKKTSEKGFTLIEVIVVGVLMMILALGAFSLFSMYTNSTRETSANLRMQRQAEAVTGELSRWVRDGASATIGGEGTSIVIRDGETPSRALASFEFNNGVVRHWNWKLTAGTAIDPPLNLPDGWPQDFQVGGQPVRTTTPSTTTNRFTLTGKQVSINMTLRAVDANGNDIISNINNLPLTQNITGAYRCRN